MGPLKISSWCLLVVPQFGQTEVLSSHSWIPCIMKPVSPSQSVWTDQSAASWRDKFTQSVGASSSIFIQPRLEFFFFLSFLRKWDIFPRHERLHNSDDEYKAAIIHPPVSAPEEPEEPPLKLLRLSSFVMKLRHNRRENRRRIFHHKLGGGKKEEPRGEKTSGWEGIIQMDGSHLRRFFFFFFTSKFFSQDSRTVSSYSAYALTYQSFQVL